MIYPLLIGSSIGLVIGNISYWYLSYSKYVESQISQGMIRSEVYKFKEYLDNIIGMNSAAFSVLATILLVILILILIKLVFKIIIQKKYQSDLMETL